MNEGEGFARQVTVENLHEFGALLRRTGQEDDTGRGPEPDLKAKDGKTASDEQLARVRGLFSGTSIKTTVPFTPTVLTKKTKPGDQPDIQIEVLAEPVYGTFLMRLGGRDTRQEPGYSRDIFIPLGARDFDPDFWGWPDQFSDDEVYPERRIDVLVHSIGAQTEVVQNVRLYYYETKHEFRLNCGQLVHGTEPGDVLIVKKPLAGGTWNGTPYEYEASIVQSDDRDYEDLLALCTHAAGGASDKVWGYAD